MTDQELFEKLKRDGECWHVLDPNDKLAVFQGSIEELYYPCKHCRKDVRIWEHKPDFSTPDGFFWLWERVWEKRMFKAFLGECEISELDPHMSPEMAVPILFKHIVHPTRFTESLKDYLNK